MDNKACASRKRHLQFKLLKPADILILALAISAVFLAAARGKKAGGILLVEAQGHTVDGKRQKIVYPLADALTFSVTGREGDIAVRIENGAASVVFAPCKNGLCVASPAIRREGEWIACVPGEVIIRITGSGKDDSEELDAIAY